MDVFVANPEPAPTKSVFDEKLQRSSADVWSGIVIAAIMLAGVVYIWRHLGADLAPVHPATALPFVLLGTALFIALGFEFVNGFHDAANAVAMVIYTHSLGPYAAVIFSGVLNFVGVLVSSGTVAYAIVDLLPVDLILKVSTGSWFAMIFALLIAAILWNLATWYKGLPASSSHTLIGSVIGVGVAYQLIQGRSGVSGIDMEQVKKVFMALLVSPVVGFVMAGVLFLLFKLLSRDLRMFKSPEGTEPPPFYIRCLLVLTCGGVSFFHGSNDGQKGMGLIMLILVGTVPTAYALNHAVSVKDVQAFAVASTQTVDALGKYVAPGAVSGNSEADLQQFVESKQYRPVVMIALQQEVSTIRNEATSYGSPAGVPAGMQAGVRNQMYLASAALTLLPKAKGAPQIAAGDAVVLKKYKGFLDRSTRFIPVWVKVAVALALGLGTMIGWKRIVVTVGEKIGKTPLTYAQGVAAQVTAMVTIGMADGFGLPVSTTHVLSSGVAGAMAANESGLRMSTVRAIAMAWLFTLPAVAVLSGCLFLLFNRFVS